MSTKRKDQSNLLHFRPTYSDSPQCADKRSSRNLTRLPSHYTPPDGFPIDRHLRELFFAVELALDPVARLYRPGGNGPVLNVHQRRLALYRNSVLAADESLSHDQADRRFHGLAEMRKVGVILHLCDTREAAAQARLGRLLAKPRAKRAGPHGPILQEASHWAALAWVTAYVFDSDGLPRRLPRSRAELWAYNVYDRNNLGPALWGAFGAPALPGLSWPASR